jgi:hypothetical protein
VEDSTVHISGRQIASGPEYKKGKKCLCLWGINKMIYGNGKYLKKAMRTFFVHSNGYKVRFVIEGRADDINGLRKYA